MTNTLLAGLFLLIAAILPSPNALPDESKSTLEFRLAETQKHTGWEPKRMRGDDQTVFVSDKVVLTAEQIEKVSFFDDATGNPVIGVTFTDSGAKAMETATSKNFNKRLAILLNGAVVSAPKIMSTIRKDATISGRFNKADLLAFFRAIVLRELPSD